MDNLQYALTQLEGKKVLYDTYFDYMEGKIPISYATRQLRDVFKSIDVNFQLNWAAVVINSEKDKISLKSITAQGQDLTELLNRNQLYLEADAVHEAALVCGESFYIVGTDRQGQAAGYYNDPRQCHVIYDPENPRTKQYAVKWWLDADKHLRVTLYFADHLEYYRSTQENTIGAANVNSFEPYVPEGLGTATPAHDFGEVPVYHFKTSQRKIVSDLLNVMAPQNAINKLVSDLMITAEFGAFKQKYIITNAEFENGKLKSSPDEVWQIPDLEAKVGEFDVTDLGNFIEAINHFATSLAIIERIPKFYLLNQGGAPSGETLIAEEAPLNKKAQDRIDSFTQSWKNAVSMLARVDGMALMPQDIVIQWAPVQTIQPLTSSTIMENRVAAGLSIEQALKMEGYSEEETASILGTPA